MMNTTTIFRDLCQQYNCKNFITDSNGKQMVELNNVLFTADKGSITPELSEFDSFDDSWYIKEYEPILFSYRLGDQYNNVLNKLIDSPTTRQAFICMTSQLELTTATPGQICTIGMSLNIKSSGYLNYTVLMRSNELIRYQSDFLWHHKIYSKLIKDIKERTGICYKKSPITWYAASFHCLEDNFDLLKNNQ